MTSTLKRCSKCGKEKDTTNYSRDKSTKSGLKSYCKSCTKLKYYSKESVAKRKKYFSSPEVLNNIKNYRLSPQRYVSHLLSKTNIKISIEEAEKRLSLKECDICASTFKSRVDSHFDHEHQTLMPRGQLCSTCNIKRIAYLESDPIIIVKALDYLAAYNSISFKVFENYFELRRINKCQEA